MMEYNHLNGICQENDDNIENENRISDVMIISSNGALPRNKHRIDERMPNTRKPNVWKNWFLIPILAAIVNVISPIYIITVISKTLASHNHEVNTDKTTVYQVIHEEVCIDCRKLSQNPYMSKLDSLMESLSRKEEDGVLKCCTNNNTQVSGMLEAIMVEKQISYPQVDIASLTTLSVRKSMKPPSAEMDKYGEQNVLKFDEDRTEQHTDHVQGVKVVENGLIVQQTGLYYVYSNIYYDPPITKPSKEVKPWVSYLRRIRPNSSSDTGALLKSIHTQCTECKQASETAFTGGVFHMNAGDLIQVSVSEADPINFSKESTYLGMVMLGRKQGAVV